MVKTLSLRHRLIKKAKDKYGEIRPTSPRKKIEDGFTYEKGGKECYFWFNTVDGSTHIVKEVEIEG